MPKEILEQDYDENVVEDENQPMYLTELRVEDPIEGPIREFISSLLKNTSLPIDAKGVKLELTVLTEEHNDESEELVTIMLTNSQRLEILEANIRELQFLLKKNALDEKQVIFLRENYEDDGGNVYRENVDENDENMEISDVSFQYQELIQRIIPGTKELAKVAKDEVVTILSQFVEWSKKTNNYFVFEDIMKCGPRLMKQVLWSSLIEDNDAPPSKVE